MNDIRYNIDNFKIYNFEDWYKYYFIFLARYFFNSKNFSGKFTKTEFVNKWIEFWFTWWELIKIFQKWIINNELIRFIKEVNWDISIYLKSIFDKSRRKNFIVYINIELIKIVNNLAIFRSFCYTIIASRPMYILEEKYNKKEYIKIQSRTLKTIWKTFWNVSKNTMSLRLKKSKEIFKKYFKITNRYTFHNGYIIQLSNLYFLDWVSYKNIKNHKYQKELSEVNNIKRDYNKHKRLEYKKIYKKQLIFWDEPKKTLWFWWGEIYEMIYGNKKGGY